MSVPRFFLDDGFLASLANVDTSFGECFHDGRLTIHVDYRYGEPFKAQFIRTPPAVRFKIHVSMSETEVVGQLERKG
jgi:hypothetical protein